MMTMYCNDCGTVFDVIEQRFDGNPWSVNEYHCTHCGSDDVEEADTCPVCGERKSPNEVLCKDCKQELAEGLDRLKEYIRIDNDTFADAIAENFGW